MSQSNEQKLLTFSGEKGAKSGSSPPVTRTPDNLRSIDTVEIILAISEGPIAQLENGAKSFYVGDTVLQNNDGTNNFEYFQLFGTQGLPANVETTLIPKLGGTSSNTAVNTSLASNVPITRQMPLNNIDAIDLRLAVSQLFRQDNNGIYDYQLDVKIEIKKSTDSFWSSAFANSTLNLKGKTTSLYIKELRIPVTRSNLYFWQVRITKLSADTNQNAATDVTWESFQTIFIPGKKYADTAILQLIGQASNQFSSIPEFSGIYKGLLVNVPVNYNTASRVYTGVWNGTFKKEWIDNPVWCLYDFITNDRYGMSTVGFINVDKFEFYEAAQWCDEMVPNGSGGVHPRFTFNALIQEPRSAIEQARFIAGVLGGTVFDDGNGTIILRVDRNDAATHLFTPENITSEGFQYSFTDINTRYNDITVSFISPNTNWQEDRRRVFDQDAIDLYGRIPYDFVAVGCIDEGEALRRAYYKLNTAITETMLVSFTTNRLGLDVRPFDVILLSDKDLGFALHGRVKSLSPDRLTVNLRDTVFLETGISYKGYFRTPDGVLERTIVTATSGNVLSFSVTSALPVNTPEYCTFSIEQSPGNGIGAPKPFRVIRIEEQEGNPDQIVITAHEVNRNKYGDSENQVVSTPTDYSGIGDPSKIPGPTNVVFRDVYSKTDNKVWTIITVTLPNSQYRFYSGEFEVYSRPVIGGTPTGAFVQRAVFYGDTLIGHPGGPHEVKILPKNTFGQVPPVGLMPTWNHNFADPSAIGVPPTPVIDVQIVPTHTGFYVRWHINSDQQDLVHHFLIKEGIDEASATILADNIQEFFYLVDPMQKRTYNLFIYAVSIAFVESAAVNVGYTNAAPQPPTNINVEVAYETIMIFFDRMTEIDIVGYRIQFRKVGDPTWLDMNPSGLFDTGEPDTAYEFRVASQDALTVILEDEIWSNPISARTRDNLSVEKGFDQVRAAATKNLIRNGSFERGLQNWHADTVRTVVIDSPAAPYADPLNGTSKVLKLGDGIASTTEIYSDKVVVRPLMPYTASIDFLKDLAHEGENHSFTLRAYDQNNALIKEYTQADGKYVLDPEQLDNVEWRRFATTFYMPALVVWAEVVITMNGTGILYVDGVQLQQGSVDTAFNPHTMEEISPEDLNLINNPDNTPPGVPTAVTATAAFRTVTLTWGAPNDTDISHYAILRSGVNDVTTATVVGTSQATVFSDVPASSGVNYYYWIRAVDTSGNTGATAPGATSGVLARTLQLSEADYQDLSIVRAKIALLAVDDARIANLSVSKLVAGVISAGDIYVGSDRISIEGNQTRIRVRDELGIERLKIGRLDVGIQNYGIEIRDATGKLVLGATGLGLNVVGNGQLLNQSVDGRTLALDTILAEHIAAGQIVASKIAASAIQASHLAVGAVTADKMAVGQLAAITADLGTVTAGVLRGAGLSGDTNFWNLNSGEFWIGSPDQAQYIRYDPLLGKIFIKGEVEFSASDVNWEDVRGRPQHLADLDPDAATKLGGMEDGADVTGTNVAADVFSVSGRSASDISFWANDPAVRINQQVTTISGGRITTGSITANKLSVATLSAISADIGTVNAGLIQNTVGTAFMNLAASGAQDFININGQFIVQANGDFTANSGHIRGDLIVDGTIGGSKITNGAISQTYEGFNSVTVDNVQSNENLVVFGWCTFGNPMPANQNKAEMMFTPSIGNAAFVRAQCFKVLSDLNNTQTRVVFNNQGILRGLTGNVTINAYVFVDGLGSWVQLPSGTLPGWQVRFFVLRVRK